MKCHICQQPSSKTCVGCSSVAYCCVEHQKLDWKNHKKMCQAFIIKQTEDNRMGWFATRDLPAGFILLEEPPAIQAPCWINFRPSETKKCICCGLGKEQDMRTCSTCSWPVCSEQCEKNPLHAENECKELTLGKLKYPPPPSWSIGMLTMCMRAKALKAREPEKFKQLMALQDDFSTPPKNQEKHPDLPQGMWKVLRGPNSLSRGDFRKLLRICRVKGSTSASNSANVLLSDGFTEFNIRVFLKSCQMNHSCSPNCRSAVAPAPDGKMRITTAIQVFKGEELTSYFMDRYCFESTVHRQVYMKENGYICNCKRCLDPTELGTFLSGIKCILCSSDETANSDHAEYFMGFLVPANPFDYHSPDQWYECHRCRIKYRYSQIKQSVPDKVWNALHGVLSLICDKSMDLNILSKLLDARLTKYEEDPTVNGHLHRNFWIIQGGMRKLIKIQMENLEGLTELELERLVRRLEFLLTIDEKLFPGSRFSQKYGDLKMLTDATICMIRRFKDASRMSEEKFKDWVEIFSKAELKRREMLDLADVVNC